MSILHCHLDNIHVILLHILQLNHHQDDDRQYNNLRLSDLQHYCELRLVYPKEFLLQKKYRQLYVGIDGNDLYFYYEILD